MNSCWRCPSTKEFVKIREQGELPIYDAAAGGDPARLLKELDAKLGIAPLDNRLSGIDWLFDALHRWVAELFAAGAAQKLVNQQIGNVPLLHAAVASGNTEAVRFLIERGADLAVQDRHGDTALSKAKAKAYAKGQQNDEIVCLLRQRHAPDFEPGSDGMAATTKAASSRHKTVGQSLAHQDGMTDKPVHEDIVKSFRTLLPEVAAVLSKSEDLAKELNGEQPMSAEQAGLFTASYLAEFEPLQAIDGLKRSRTAGLHPSGVIARLHANRDNFREFGLMLEASRPDDIRRVLGSLG
ncbi:MAG TPA: ankyrin repeat domain-containing protein [Noviherbaspirillum sp.]